MQTISRQEREAHLRVTDAWVSAAVIKPIVRRRISVSDGAGGELSQWSVVEGLNPAVRLDPLSGQQFNEPLLTAEGILIAPNYYLTTMPSVDIQRFDHLEHDDVTYEVLRIDHFRAWRLNAMVVAYG